MSINKFRIKKKSDGSLFNPKVWFVIEFKPIWWLPIWKDWKTQFNFWAEEHLSSEEKEEFMRFNSVEEADKFINQQFGVENRVYDVTIKSVTIVYR
jgi:hypothetical protein